MTTHAFESYMHIGESSMVDVIFGHEKIPKKPNRHGLHSSEEEPWTISGLS